MHARIAVPYFAPMIDIVGVQCAQTASRINHVVCAMQKAAQEKNEIQKQCSRLQNLDQGVSHEH